VLEDRTIDQSGVTVCKAVLRTTFN